MDKAKHGLHPSHSGMDGGPGSPQAEELEPMATALIDHHDNAKLGSLAR